MDRWIVRGPALWIEVMISSVMAGAEYGVLWLQILAARFGWHPHGRPTR